MKIEVKDLRPNPFRDMKNYPIDEAKVQSLINSMDQTGFWDNILARKSDKGVEIAYGHHRLIALQRKLKPSDTVDIPLRDLDDATMIRIMANENDDLYRTNPKVIDETVRATRTFLLQNPEIAKDKSLAAGGQSKWSKEALRISVFLNGNWSEHRVYAALERLSLYDIESKTRLDRDSVQSMPTDGAARSFTAAVKELKNVTPQTQRRAVARIEKEQTYGKADIKRILREEKVKHLKKDTRPSQELIEFEAYLEEVAKQMGKLCGPLDRIVEMKPAFDSEIYSRTIEKFDFVHNAQKVMKRLNILLGGKTNVEAKHLPRNC